MTTEPPSEEPTASTPPEPAQLPPPSPPPGRQRRLTRSREQRVLGGVAGGLGEYLGVDPVLIRIAWVILVIAGVGTGLILYIIAWIIIPEAEPGESSAAVTSEQHHDTGMAAAIMFGVVLIAVGVVALLRAVDIQGPSLQQILIGVLALVGIGLIAQARRGLNGGLVFLGVVLTLILTAVSGASLDLDIDSDEAFGSEDARPATADALKDKYEHAFGSITLDLRDLDVSTLPSGTTNVQLDVAFGSIEIRIGDVPVRIESDAVFGSSCQDRTYNDYETADRRIFIDASAAFGSCEAR